MKNSNRVIKNILISLLAVFYIEYTYAVDWTKLPKSIAEQACGLISNGRLVNLQSNYNFNKNRPDLHIAYILSGYDNQQTENLFLTTNDKITRNVIVSRYSDRLNYSNPQVLETFMQSTEMMDRLIDIALNDNSVTKSTIEFLLSDTQIILRYFQEFSQRVTIHNTDSRLSMFISTIQNIFHLSSQGVDTSSMVNSMMGSIRFM